MEKAKYRPIRLSDLFQDENSEVRLVRDKYLPISKASIIKTCDRQPTIYFKVRGSEIFSCLSNGIHLESAYTEEDYQYLPESVKQRLIKIQD